MAILQVAIDVANNGDNTAIAVFGSEPTVGNPVVLFTLMRNDGGTFTFPSGFAQDFTHVPTNRTFEAQSKVYAGEGNSFTVTRSDATSDMYLIAYELTANSEFDQSDTAAGTNTQLLTVGPITPTHDDSAIMTGIMWAGNITGQAVNESFVLDGAGDPRGDTASKEVVATAAYDVDWTWTGLEDSDGVMISYGVPAAGGGHGMLLAQQRNHLVRPA